MPHVSHNSGKEEWYTPSNFIEAARNVLGSIDLDPASNPIANTIVKANKYYTKSENGLEKDWKGNVWLNPPYTAGLVDLFARKLVKEYNDGNVRSAIILTNNGTETKWGQLLLENCTAVCFPSKRVKFLDVDLKPIGAPLQGQMLCYFGEHVDNFHIEFKNIGVIL